MRNGPSGDSLLLGALIAVHALPIWTLSHFPSQDGPVHLAIANILREHGGPQGQVLWEYFVLDPGAVTNRFVYLLLAHGLRFLLLALAEKVFPSAYVILLSLSVRCAVRAVEPRNARVWVSPRRLAELYRWREGARRARTSGARSVPTVR